MRKGSGFRVRGSESGTRRIAASMALLIILGGCSHKPPPEPESVSDTMQRGPLKLVVTAQPKDVWVGDPITLRLDVHTPEGTVVEFPQAEEIGGPEESKSAAAGGSGAKGGPSPAPGEEAPTVAVDVQGGPPRDPRPAADGGLDWSQTFTITPLTSGVLEIPPLTVKYAAKPTAAEKPDFEQELVAGTLKIEVRSALTTQDSVARPRQITEPLLPPFRLTGRAWLAVAAGVVGLALLIVLIAWLIRRRIRRPAQPILPEVWALRQFAILAGSDWIEAGRAREYYYELTYIVRTYIELKFGLAAPEMTTEEFLNTLAHNRGALPYDAYKLREFLEACDIVKYAAFDPSRIDAEQALGTARAFVDATAAAAMAQQTRGGMDTTPPGSGVGQPAAGGQAA